MTESERLAREEIRVTLAQYTFAGDRGDMAELGAAFTPDAKVELLGETFAGREAIMAGLGATIDLARRGPGGESLTFLRHNLTSSKVTFNSPSEAKAWTYFSVLTPLGLDHCGVYVDRFVVAGERWLIADRRIKVDWSHEHSLVV